MESVITDLIIQNEADMFLDNMPDQPGNRIKLKPESRQNLLRHLKNIPYQVKKGPKMKTAKINLPKEFEDFNITTSEYIKLKVAKSKPINVKTAMFDNINQNGSKYLEKKMAEPIEEEPPVVVEVPVEETVVEEPVMETFISDIPEIANEYEGMSSIIQNVQEVKELAEKVQTEVDQSEEEINQLKEEYVATEEDLELAKIKKEELKQKVLLALADQSKILKNVKKEYESVIQEANRRKEENKNKIVEFQNQISQKKKLLEQERAEIIEQQALLNALSGIGEEENFTSEEKETKEVHKKVA